MSKESPGTLIVHLSPGEAVLRQRYASLSLSRERPVLSPRAFEEHLAAFEPPGGDEPVIHLPTEAAVGDWLEARAARRNGDAG